MKLPILFFIIILGVGLISAPLIDNPNIPLVRKDTSALSSPIIPNGTSANDTYYFQGYVPTDFWKAYEDQTGLTGNKAGSFNLTTTGYIKVGSNPDYSGDSKILLARSVNDDVSGNGHGFADDSIITRSGGIAYNSFDSRVEFTGTNNYNHYSGVQIAPIYSSSGTMSNFYGEYQRATINSGAISNMYDIYLAKPQGSGITNMYGIYLEDLTAGSSNNYQIYSAGGNALFNNGNVIATRFVGNGSTLTDVCLQNGSNCQSYAQYNFTNNNFNGSGDFNTTGNVDAEGIGIFGYGYYGIIGNAIGQQAGYFTNGVTEVILSGVTYALELTGNSILHGTLTVDNNINTPQNVTAYYYYGSGANWTDDIYNATKEPTGFSQQSTFNSVLSFDNSLRNFTISGDYYIYFKGRKIHKTTSDSVIIPNDAGYTNYIYFNALSGDVLTTSQTPWGNDFENVIQVATVFWNGSMGIIGKERHGVTMDSATHYYLHSTVGTRYVSGFTGLFSDPKNWNMTSGTIADEDNIDTNPIQNASRIFFHTATGRYNFQNYTKDLYYNISDVIQYDTLTGTADVTNNQYVAYWVIESVDRDVPTYLIMGQRTDVTLANAQLNNKWESMSLGTLDIPEYKLLYRVIMRRNGVSAPTVSDVQDLRSVSNLPSGTYVATDHGVLTGLLDDDHTQYLLTDGTRSMNGNLNMGTNNITNVSLQIMNEISGACDLTINHSICANSSGLYLTG